LSKFLHTVPMDKKELCQLIRQLCTCLFSLHDSRMTHRDLKPDNVLVSMSAGAPSLVLHGGKLKECSKDVKINVKLCDFGSSQLGFSPRLSTGSTTTQYSPPEEILQKPVVSQGDDRFRFGMIILELCLKESLYSLMQEVKPPKCFIEKLAAHWVANDCPQTTWEREDRTEHATVLYHFCVLMFRMKFEIFFSLLERTNGLDVGTILEKWIKPKEKQFMNDVEKFSLATGSSMKCVRESSIFKQNVDNCAVTALSFCFHPVSDLRLPPESFEKHFLDACQSNSEGRSDSDADAEGASDGDSEGASDCDSEAGSEGTNDGDPNGNEDDDASDSDSEGDSRGTNDGDSYGNANDDASDGDGASDGEGGDCEGAGNGATNTDSEGVGNGVANTEALDVSIIADYALESESNVCLPDHMRTEVMDTDGNCLFRAISDQLCSDGGGGHGTVRTNICNHMNVAEEHFSPFLTTNSPDVGAYIEHMREDGCWGGNLELAAAAQHYW
jgi:serine/threonine protein kinase